MKEMEDKIKLAILRLLQAAGGAASSQEVARGLAENGVALSPRSIRLYMQRLTAAGLLAPARRGRSGGCSITPRGIAEIDDAGVVKRLGFIQARIDQMAFHMTYHPRTAPGGTVILNVTVIDSGHVNHALREMAVVFQAGLGMGQLVGLFNEGTTLGNLTIPPRSFGIGTVCSVTLNGILLKSGIPIQSDFGAVLEMAEGRPLRLTDLIVYGGTTVDPLEIFIKAGLSQVHAAAITGNGRIGVSFRQIPSCAAGPLEHLRSHLQKAGLDGILCLGKSGAPLLDFPVHEGRTGLLVAGGLNPAAAVEEAGIPTRSQALSMLYPASSLIHFRDMQQVAYNMLNPR